MRSTIYYDLYVFAILKKRVSAKWDEESEEAEEGNTKWDWEGEEGKAKLDGEGEEGNAKRNIQGIEYDQKNYQRRWHQSHYISKKTTNMFLGLQW